MKEAKHLHAWRVATVALLVALGGGLLPSAGAQDAPPLLDLDLGSAYESNFNDDNGGFEASPVPPPPPTTTWEHGVPTSGPGVAYSGDNVWATKLDGNYMTNDCGVILSPPISIPAGGTASVSFQQWRHIEESTSSTSFAWDAGLLFATTNSGASYSLVNPDGGYTSKRIGSTTRSCLFAQPTGQSGLSGPPGTTVPAPVYSPVSADLSNFAGQTVQFAIGFGSDGSVTRAGWYIDDFAVTINGSTTVETFESGNGGFTAISLGTPRSPLGWEHGVATAGPAGASNLDGNVWGTNLEGTYGYEECASLTSPVIDLGAIPEGLAANEATLRWQQWYQSSTSSAAGVVQVDAGDGFQTITPLGGYPEDNVASTVLEACLGEDSPGFEGTMQADGADLADFEADLSQFIGSQIRFRFLFASTTSNPIGEGWYIDNVGVDLAFVVHTPVIEEPSPDVGALLGWTSGGVNSSWEYGSHSGPGAPDAATGYDTNLDGLHNPNECSFIDSPPVAGNVFASDPTLSFDHSYIIGSDSPTATSAFDGGAVFTSVDDGATWQYLALPEYTSTSEFSAVTSCFGTTTEPVFHGRSYADAATPELSTVTADLSALSGASTVRVRFSLASSSVVEQEGWFVKNVQLGGVTLLP